VVYCTPRKNFLDVRRSRQTPVDRTSRRPGHGVAVGLYRALGPAGEPGTRLRRAGEISRNTPGLDLSTKLRVFQRALRSQVERRSALLDIVRAVNTTLDPQRICGAHPGPAASWVSGAVLGGRLVGSVGPAAVLADRA